jgi:tetratricopeptide (TPR) repeat protein
LGDAFPVAYRNADWRVYAPTPAALDSKPFAALSAAYEAAADGRLEEAAVLLQEILAATPDNTTAQVLLAQVHIRAGRAAEASALARAVAQRAPGSAWAQMLLGEIERNHGDWAEAQGDKQGAAAAYRAALAANPDDSLSAYKLAQYAGADGSRPQAQADSMAAISALSDATAYAPARPASERRQAFWTLGAAQEAIGNLAEAETAYRAALELTRQWDTTAQGEAIAQLAQFYARRGDASAAQQLFAEGVQRYPAAAALYTAWAELAAENEMDAPAAIYAAAAANNPLAAWPRIAQARLMLQHGLGSAEEDEVLTSVVHMLQETIDRDSQSQAAYELSATVARSRDDSSAEIEVWRQAAKANPQAVWPLTALAAAAERGGDYATALAAYQNAAALAPNSLPLQQARTHTEELWSDLQQVQEHWQAHGRHTAATTFVPVDEELDGWTLVGYYADHHALVAGDTTPAWLYWRAPDQGSVEAANGAEWTQIGGTLWVQKIDHAKNLVSDGSFARSAAVGRVIGFPQELYGAAPHTRRLERLMRRGEPDYAARLANGPANPNTSLVSPSIPVAPDTIYLQEGSVRSVDGNAFLGRRWSGSDAGEVVEEYMLPGVGDGTWMHARQLAAPPPGATEIEMLLLNLRTAGSALYDDLMLLPIHRPPQVGPLP